MATAQFVVTGPSAAKAEERAAEVTLRSEVQAGQLVIEPFFPGARNSEEGASVEVIMPALTKADVTTSNGTISVEDVGGDVVASTSNGRIILRGIAGAARASTSNGSVELSRVGGSGEVSTSNGSVTAGQVRGPLTIRTSNGSIRVEDAASPVNLSTSNGSLTLELGPDFSGTLELRTSNGRIRVEDDVTAPRIRIDRNDARVQFDDSGPLSTGRTSNGSISVRKRR